MGKKHTKTYGKDPQLLQTGRKSKRITPGVRNLLLFALVLLAAAEVLLRLGLIPADGALAVDVVRVVLVLLAAAGAVRSGTCKSREKPRLNL